MYITLRQIYSSNFIGIDRVLLKSMELMTKHFDVKGCRQVKTTKNGDLLVVSHRADIVQDFQLCSLVSVSLCLML